MKRKILSLALALMMILSVAVTLPVSAEVEDVVMTVNPGSDDDYTVAFGTPTSANLNTEATPVGGTAQAWAGTSYASLTSGNPTITWTFVLPESGAYDIYVAYAGKTAGTTVSVSTGANNYENNIATEIGVDINADNGSTYLYPMETKLASSIAFKAGETNTLKLTRKVQTGRVYAVKLVHVSDTDVVVPARTFTNDASTGGNLSDDFSTVAPWAPKGGFTWTAKNTEYIYSVNVFEDGYYKIHFLAGGSKGIDLIVGENQLLDDFAIGSGEDTPVVTTSDALELTADTHDFTFTGPVGNSASFYGFKLEYIGAELPTEPDEPVVQYTITAEATAGGTATGTATVDAGETVTLTATADEGYNFIGWFDGATKVSEDAEYTVEAIADKTYTAKFEAISSIEDDSFIMKLEAGDGYTVTIIGNDGNPTTTVTETLTVAADSEVYDWGLTSRYAFNNSNRSIQWDFEVSESGLYDIYVAANANAESATINAALNGGDESTINLTTDTSIDWKTYPVQNLIATDVSFDKDSQNTLKLTPGPSLGNRPSIYGVKLVYKGAESEPAVQYTITAEATAGGTATGTATVNAGESVTLTATADTGYSFIGWFDGATKVSEDRAYTFTPVESKTYTAKFEPIPEEDGTVVMTVNPGSDDDYTVAFGTPTSANLNTEATPVGGTAQAWAGTSYASLTSNNPTITWTFEVSESGAYDIYVAYAGKSTGTTVSVSTGANALEDNIAREIEVATYGSTDTNYVYPMQTKLASSIAFKAGVTNTLKLTRKAQTGRVYAVKLVPVSDTDVVVPARTFTNSVVPGAHKSDDFSTVAPWAPKGGFTWTSKKDEYIYSVNVFETGYYKIHFLAGGYKGIDLIVGGEKLLADFAIGSGVNTPEVTTSYALKLTEGTHDFTFTAPVGDGAFFYGFKLEYIGADLPSDAASLKLVGNDDLAINGAINAGTKVYGEIVTNDANAKIYVVNYTVVNGMNKMVSYSESTAVADNDGHYIIRTSKALTTSAGTVKVFLWTDDGNYIPLVDSVEVTIN